MVRNVLGSVLAVVGAAAAVYSPFRTWYDDRLGRTFRLQDLFSAGGVTDSAPDLALSLLLPFSVAAVVTLVGIALRARPLVVLAGLVVLGFTILWMVRQGQDQGSLTVNGQGTGLGIGVAGAFGGGVLLLVAPVVMSGRRPARGTPAHGAFGSGTAFDDDDDDRFGAPEPYGSSYGSGGGFGTAGAPGGYGTPGTGSSYGSRGFGDGYGASAPEGPYGTSEAYGSPRGAGGSYGPGDAFGSRGAGDPYGPQGAARPGGGSPASDGDTASFPRVDGTERRPTWPRPPDDRP